MRVNKNNGFSLVTSLGMIAALTLIVGALGLRITNERGKLNIKNEEDRLTLIARSLERVGIEKLKFQAKTNFDTALASYWGSGDIVPTNTTTQENNGQGFLTSGLVELNEDNEVALSQTFNKINIDNRNLGNPIKFKILFFNDKDNDGTLDAGLEETSYLVSKNISTDNLRHSYTYNFNITTYAYTGDFSTTKLKRKISTNGNFTLTTAPDSFAKYAMFLNQSSGAMFWWGDTIRGPFHSNDKIIFAGDLANGGKSGTFHGKVTSASNDVAWYYLQNNSWKNGGTTTPPASDKNPKLVASDGTVRVAPDFKEGFERGVATIPLPTNAFNQKNAALGHSDTSSSASLTNAQQRALLGLSSSSSAVPNGIYLPSKDVSGNPVLANNPPNNSITNGGIYIQGNVDSIIMSTPSNPGSDGIAGTADDYSNQEYLIKQGSNLRRITVDYETGTTKYETLNATTNAVTATNTVIGTTNGVIQVNGTVNFVGGPPRTDSNDPNTAPPAIHSKNQLTLSATGDIIIQRDIKYQSDPRGSDGSFGTADDNMNAKNVLGFFSSTGNVRIGTQTQKDFTLHGVVMGSGNNKGFRVDNATSRPQSGKIHLLGGTIEGSLSSTENSSGTTGFGTDYTYDQRTGRGLAPPFFPGSTIPAQQDPLIQITSTYESIIR